MDSNEIRKIMSQVTAMRHVLVREKKMNQKEAYETACTEIGKALGLSSEELRSKISRFTTSERVRKSDSVVNEALSKIMPDEDLRSRSAKVHRLILSGASMRAVFQEYFSRYDDLIVWPEGYALATGRGKHGYTQYFSTTSAGYETLWVRFGWRFLVDGKPLTAQVDINDGSVLRIQRPVTNNDEAPEPTVEKSAPQPDKMDAVIRLLGKISVQLEAILNVWSK